MQIHCYARTDCQTGQHFKSNLKTILIYRMILCEMYSCKIETVNKFLVSLNIPPLTRLGAKM